MPPMSPPPNETSNGTGSDNAGKTGLTYKDSGVDIDAGAALVEAIKPLSASTKRPGADGALGGFGGLFDLKAAGFLDPVLVAANDGVGTKVKLAIEAGRHETIGINLVAMCVNDLIVQGAEPLFFLDYFATGALSVETGAEIVAGVAEGCRQAGCALIGGETAEMPGLYAGRDYDLAGFSVGAAERGALLDGSAVSEGDIVLGLASSGVHSNGYSLVRRIVDESGLALADPAPFQPDISLGEALLTPTRIYVRAVLSALRRDPGAAGAIHGLAHITGGGFYENLPRVAPDSLGFRLKALAWPRPPVFDWIAETGGVSAPEMHRTFNCGIGMALIVERDRMDAVTRRLTDEGEAVYVIGGVVARRGDDPAVVIDGLEP